MRQANTTDLKQLRALADIGLTITETARWMGRPVVWVRRWANRTGIRFEKHARRPPAWRAPILAAQAQQRLNELLAPIWLIHRLQ